MVQAYRSGGGSVHEMWEDGMTNIIMVTILGAPLVIMALKEIGWWL